MTFDNTCKFIAENFSRDIATWLLGQPINLTQLDLTELSVEPIRADSLVLLESGNTILHIEFQTDPNANIPFRMADYRLRIYRRYPEKSMHQVVIYLRPTNSPLVQQNVFTIPGTTHEFQVIRLWEESANLFFQSPGLLPFAVLGQGEDKTSILRQVATEIDQIPSRQTRSNLAASTAVLSGLVLEQDLVQQILRRDIMRESSVYQAIKAEGKAEGETEGEARGEEKKALEIARNLLNTGMEVNQVAQLTGLSVEQVQQLSR